MSWAIGLIGKTSNVVASFKWRKVMEWVLLILLVSVIVLPPLAYSDGYKKGFKAGVEIEQQVNSIRKGVEP